MQIIIDGYNFIKSVVKKNFISDSERSFLSHQIALYGKSKGHKILIVFDGGPFMWPIEERTGGIDIVYVGQQMSADAYIITYLQEHCLHDPLLVSSDKQIRNAAAALQLDSLSSFEFYRFIRYHLDRQVPASVTNTGIQKRNNVPEAVDLLMIESSQKTIGKDSDTPLEQIPDLDRKISKRLAKKLKNL
jgi:predicted RNA-binding protein with PIN domain